MNEISGIRLDVPNVRSRPGVQSGAKVAFENTFKEFLQEVNAQQMRAEEMTKAFARGEVQDLHEVVLARHEAEVSLRLMIQMRDRVIAAYQEVMRMPV